MSQRPGRCSGTTNMAGPYQLLLILTPLLHTTPFAFQKPNQQCHSSTLLSPQVLEYIMHMQVFTNTYRGTVRHLFTRSFNTTSSHEIVLQGTTCILGC
jgi:hypothetical protein